MAPKKEFAIVDDLSIIRQTLLWLESGQSAALATVIKTWGSAPRPIGSQMAISENGIFVGSISGGCVEGQVVTEAMSLIRKKQNKDILYEISNSTAQKAGLSCGGKLHILINWISDEKKEPLKIIFEQCLKFKPAWLEIKISDGAFRTIIGDLSNADPNLSPHPQSTLIPSLPPHEVFIRAFVPNPRLLIVGGVHIAQILSSLALQAGYEVVLIDPRDTWATSERFPGIDITREWPSKAISNLLPDDRTAIVTLSHDPKIDDPALLASFAFDPFYIGSLGSKKTHALRVARLKKAGISPSKIKKVFAPVGLNINAKSPFEISISIMAQMIEAYRTRK